MDIPRSYIVAAQVGRYFALAFGIFFAAILLLVVAGRIGVISPDAIQRFLNVDGTMRTMILLSIMSGGGIIIFIGGTMILKWLNPQ